MALNPTMPNEVYLVYQDCPECEPHKRWFEKQKEIAAKNGIKIVKLPFFRAEAPALIKVGCKQMGLTLPFFTDGIVFSKNLDPFVIKAEVIMTPAPKKHKSNRKKAKNGAKKQAK